MSKAKYSEVGNPCSAPFHHDDLDSGTPRSLPDEDEAIAFKDDIDSQPERCHIALNSSLTPAEKLHRAAVKVHAVVKFTRVQRLKRRARWLTKKLIVFILSHVGLTSLVALYAVAGGFIFQVLESNSRFANETKNVTETITINYTFIQALRDQYVEQLWDMTESYNVLHPNVWKTSASKELDTYGQLICTMVIHEMEKSNGQELSGFRKTGNSDKTLQRDSTDWTYPRALLFAITIITTIGYGDTVPNTWEAKVVVMLYALFGIPMTLLCLANIGSLLASVYRFTWKHISHFYLVLARAPERNNPKPKTSQVRVPVLVSLTTMIAYILGGATIFSSWEDWSFLDGSYFCFVTLSTIGFGDYVPGKNRDTFDSNTKRVVCALYLLFGLALLSMVFQLIQDTVLDVISRYASFLGLSESKIEKDIEECSNDEKASKLTGCGIEKIQDMKMTKPIQESEAGDAKPSEEKYKRFIDVAHSAKKLQQPPILPTQGKNRKTERTSSRLQLVPKDNISKLGNDDAISGRKFK